MLTPNQPYLPMDLEILDAKGLYEGAYSSESLYISYVNGRYYLKSRVHDLGGVDWTTHFQVTRQQAREIVSLGYANWWLNVDKSAR